MVYNKNSGGDIRPINGYESLSKFGTKIDSSNQRVKFTHLATRYRVRFIGLGRPSNNFTENGWIDNPVKQMCEIKFGSNDDLTMDMREFSPPSGEFEDQIIETVNGQIKYPGKWTWSGVSFKVYNSYDNMNYKLLFNQIQKQRDLYDQTTGTVPENYKFKTVFEHTDGHQNSVAYWVMEGCYLKKAVPSAGGNNGAHEATTIDCDMTFDNAILIDYDGTLITGYGATTTYLDRVRATVY